jgi:hypothetical protein
VEVQQLMVDYTESPLEQIISVHRKKKGGGEGPPDLSPAILDTWYYQGGYFPEGVAHHMQVNLLQSFDQSHPTEVFFLPYDRAGDVLINPGFVAGGQENYPYTPAEIPDYPGSFKRRLRAYHGSAVNLEFQGLVYGNPLPGQTPAPVWVGVWIWPFTLWTDPKLWPTTTSSDGRTQISSINYPLADRPPDVMQEVPWPPGGQFSFDVDIDMVTHEEWSAWLNANYSSGKPLTWATTIQVTSGYNLYQTYPWAGGGRSSVSRSLGTTSLGRTAPPAPTRYSHGVMPETPIDWVEYNNPPDPPAPPPRPVSEFASWNLFTKVTPS